MNHAARLALLAIAGVVLSPVRAAEPYASWDNFNGVTALNPSRWQGTDRIRLIQGGALRVAQRDLGNQSSNVGLLSNSWDTYLKNPTLIRQLRAKVTVSDYALTACATNPSASSVEARLVGLYFNAGPGVPTSLINDVGAKIRLWRSSNAADAANVVRVQGVVFQCTAADCNTNDITLGTAELGAAVVGETLILKMEWDPTQKVFNFARGTDPVVQVPYSASDAQAPWYAFRGIGTRTSMANCLAGNRTDGFIDARFDTINVNASAAP